MGINDIELPEAGDYSVVVNTEGCRNCPFDLHIEWLSPLAKHPDQEISFGETISRELDSAELDLLRLAGRAGDVISLDLSGPGLRQFDPLFELFGPRPVSGVIETGGAGIFEIQLSETGTYTLRVHQDIPSFNPASFDTSYTATVSLLSRLDREFQRGDVDADGKVNLTDPINILGFLFFGSFRPDCRDALDANDDGGVNLADAVFLLTFLFRGGDEIRSPFRECGTDVQPEEPDLGCESFTLCP